MLALFNSLKGFVSYKKTVIDNWIFHLHYGVTSVILVVFSVIVTTDQFFGDPINCFSFVKDAFPEKFLDNYCWVHSTFTLPKAMGKRVGIEVSSVGVDTHIDGEPTVYHHYYQWVCFFLAVQAMFFYAPRYIWKNVEEGKIEHILLDLNQPMILADDNDKCDWNHDSKYDCFRHHQIGACSKISALANYMMDTLGEHNRYAVCYFLCEFLNLVNVLLQIYITDAFLGGEFSSYGTDVLRFTTMDQVNRVDPMTKVFPHVTKCFFHRFGPTGDVQKHDALCVLPINVINEKIFVFLWFWFVVLAIVDAFQFVLYRMPLFCCKKIRWRVLTFRRRFIDKKQLETVLLGFGFGDWLVLNFLSKNMDPLHFRGLVERLDRIISVSYIEELFIYQ